MRTTLFQFDIRLRDADQEAQFQRLREELSDVKGVVRVDGRRSSVGCDLSVHVEFPDAEAAKKMHRALVNRLLKMSGVEVRSATSNLTDIFD